MNFRNESETPELELIKMAFSLRTSVLVPEGSIHTFKKRKQPTVVPSYDSNEQYQQPVGHNITLRE